MTPVELVRREPDLQKLTEIFASLEFRTLISRVKKRLAAPAPAQPSLQGSLFGDDDEVVPAMEEVSEPESIEVEIKQIESEADLQALAARIRKAGGMALYSVADGEADMTAEAAGWAVALPGSGDTYWISAALNGGDAMLAEMYEAEDVRVISSQVKRDYVLLCNRLGLEMLSIKNYLDVTVIHYILQPDMRHALSLMASSVLGIELPDYESIAGKKGVKQLQPSAIPGETLLPWAGAQVQAVSRLHEPLLKEVERKDMTALLQEIELPLIPVLADMEIAGVRIDVGALNEAAEQLTSRLSDLKRIFMSLPARSLT